MRLHNPLALLAVCASLSGLATGCAEGRGVLTVHVASTGGVRGVAQLRVTVTVETGGQTGGPYDFKVPNGPISIPPEVTFTVAFAPQSSKVRVHVDALGDGGLVIASGDGEGEVRPSQDTDVTVDLVAPVIADMTVLPDLAGDASIHDLGSLDARDASVGDGRGSDLGDLGSDGGADLAVCGVPGSPCCDNITCMMGCCQGGMCQAGTSNNLCGSGGTCNDCAGAAAGSICINGKCGCSAAAQCPLNKACDVTVSACTGACNGNTTVCNGGCCAAGACVGGTLPTACGVGGGFCNDCSALPAGHACVAGVCGCNGPNDCAPGNACDKKGQCTITCAGLLCNTGCCDGTNCVTGTANNACGANGGACIACGLGTPTCSAGACTSSCSVGQNGGAGICGNGFCCGATNTCAKVADSACGLSGAACVNCATSPRGPFCASGLCSCAAATDCPMGQACSGGVCGAKCDAMTLCNGACCDVANGLCAPGSGATACGTAGGVCANCTVNFNPPAGKACVAAKCACLTSADCQPGTACNLTNHVCGTACDMSNPCNGGCCTAAMNGMCVAGTGTGACGNNGGTCANCATGLQNGTSGGVCLATAGGGFCGCGTVMDCPQSQSCTNMLCTSTCSMNSPCNAGCCSNTNSCLPGNSAKACGGLGTCADCTLSAIGHACLANTQKCGCNTSVDCPVGTACNTTSHSCGSACDVNTPCNGGCCSAGMNGSCVMGAAQATCGAKGAVCADCTAPGSAGSACLSGLCGCTTAADCPSGKACNTMTKTCETTCGDNQHTACNGGCCGGTTCVAGTSNGACGANGLACAACGNGTPTCNGTTCTATCGANTNGTCGGNTCCANTMCVTGSAPTACGSGGTCVSCANNANGSNCVQNMKGAYVCGCTTSKDCGALQACNPATGVCSNSCAGGLTCNAGCCNPGSNTCVTGKDPSACGIPGTACMSCLNNNNGHGCVLGANSASCGCNMTSDCLPNSACNTTTHMCTKSCSVTMPCNGGCCAGGSCAQGTANNACGASGGGCLDCTNNVNGAVCLSGKTCGCNSAADCTVQASTCTNSACCVPRGFSCTANGVPCCAGSSCLCMNMICGCQ